MLVMIITRILAVATTVFVAGAVAAQEEDLCKPYLIPLGLEARSGGHGSVWINELWIQNDSDDARRIVRRIWQDHRLVSVPQTIPPRTSVRLQQLTRGVEGEFLYLDKPSSGLFMDLRTRAIGGASRSAGTSVPLVGQDSAKMRQQLLNVPLDARYRYALRIYTFDNLTVVPVGTADNRVRIYDASSNAVLVDERIQFNGWDVAGRACGIDRPYRNALFDLFAKWSHLEGKSVRIELESNLYSFWPMLSLTNNDSNEVTIIVPKAIPR